MSKEMHADLVIIGGGTGGCAAALAAAKMGVTVIMTEETPWIGGQLTSQAVPPDEHPWIEQFGCTRSYRRFREGVRQYYRDYFPLTTEARANVMLNPGNGWVSRICHEPRTALAVLRHMMAPYVHSGRLTILTRYRVESARTEGDNVLSITVEGSERLDRIELTAPYFLDATECGDVLPLAGIEYVTGAESQRQTGEPHALEGDPEPMDMQAFTYCFAMDYLEGENHTIDKPGQYAFWRDYKADFWPDRLLSWTGVKPATLEPIRFDLFPDRDWMSLMGYRRIVDRSNFAPGTYRSDISLVNWQQNDYWLGSVIDVSEEEKARHLEGAKQLESVAVVLDADGSSPAGRQAGLSRPAPAE